MKRPSLGQLTLYFLKLGSLGFGGDDGLAIAAACPGPLAYQLAVYCGYVRFGVLGGLAVAVAFAFTPFFLVIGAACAYTQFAASWQLRALFYGIGPVVVALILKACWNLGKKTLGRDRLAWLFFSIACAVTVLVQRELAPLFVVAGILGAFVFARPGPKAPTSTKETPPFGGGKKVPLLFPAIAGAGGGMTLKLFLFFFKTGLLVFGSGLVIVPFLKTYVVDQYHWLGNREFLDSVAIGMISPGPVVITATFVGFLLKGLPGAVAATVGIFAPAILFTLLATPLLLRYHDNRRLRGFIRGVTVAVVGVLVGTTYLVGRTAIGDWPTAAIGLVTLVVLLTTKKVPEPIIVLAGGIIGLLAFQLIQPDWLLR